MERLIHQLFGVQIVAADAQLTVACVKLYFRFKYWMQEQLIGIFWATEHHLIGCFISSPNVK